MSARSKNSVSVGPGISLEGARHRRCDRRREQYAPFAALDHAWQLMLGEVHRGAHVEIDDSQVVVDLGVADERAAGTDPGVQRERIDGPVCRFDPVVQLMDALIGRAIDLNGLERRTRTAQALHAQDGVTGVCPSEELGDGRRRQLSE